MALQNICTFCTSTRQAEFDTKASVDQRMKEASKESGQHFPSPSTKFAFGAKIYSSRIVLKDLTLTSAVKYSGYA